MLKNGGVGVKVKGNSAPPDSNSIFRIGSVSKVFAVSLRIAIIIIDDQNCCFVYRC